MDGVCMVIFLWIIILFIYEFFVFYFDDGWFYEGVCRICDDDDVFYCMVMSYYELKCYLFRNVLCFIWWMDGWFYESVCEEDEEGENDDDDMGI